MMQIMNIMDDNRQVISSTNNLIIYLSTYQNSSSRILR
jgi:hypothetical protein